MKLLIKNENIRRAYRKNLTIFPDRKRGLVQAFVKTYEDVLVFFA
jgi:hypothetical protein